TDDLNTRDRHELADLLHTEFRLAPRDNVADGCWRLRNHELPLHRLHDTEPLQHGREIEAAHPALGMCDRFGGEKRALKRFRRTDLGLRSAPAHRKPDARGGNIQPTARD